MRRKKPTNPPYPTLSPHHLTLSPHLILSTRYTHHPILSPHPITTPSHQVFDEAKEAYREAMQIYLSHYGRENAEVAKVTNNFATLLDAMGERDEALFFYDQALSTLKRLYGETHPQVLGNPPPSTL